VASSSKENLFQIKLIMRRDFDCVPLSTAKMQYNRTEYESCIFDMKVLKVFIFLVVVLPHMEWNKRKKNYAASS
jgi:hypothetical protein